MLKAKRNRFVLVAIVIFSMVAMYGYMPSVEAADLDSAKVTLSDSDVSISATSTVEFNMGDANFLTPGYYVRVEYESDFGVGGSASATTTCPSETTASSTGQRIDCVVDAGGFLESTSTQTIIIGEITNPGVAQSYYINITTYDDSDVEIESTQVRVAIIDDVVVTATVDATLTFTIGNVNAEVAVGSVTTTGTTTAATAVDFDSLTVNATSTMAQSLSVTTNAPDGFTVTVQQDQELTNAAGDTINSFNNSQDGTGSTTPQGWAPPGAVLASDHTYGHLGVTSDDTGVFTSGQFAGISGESALSVFSHNTGPTDGTITGQGTTNVAYSIQVSSLQEAGDYSANFTYVCTPTY